MCVTLCVYALRERPLGPLPSPAAWACQGLLKLLLGELGNLFLIVGTGPVGRQAANRSHLFTVRKAAA